MAQLPYRSGGNYLNNDNNPNPGESGRSLTLRDER